MVCVWGEHSYEFEKSCEIHDPESKLGYVSPRTVLPSKAESTWLFASEDEIKKWYEIGKKECNAYLSTAKFGSDLPDPYGFGGGQRKCRGTDMLYSLSGIILWPFGPVKSTCPTYSKCWYGVLSCGAPKIDKLKEFGRSGIQDLLNKYYPNEKIPEQFEWSIRALYIHMRIIGHEIVIPEQKYITININKDISEDVLIAQYILTIPNQKTSIELRQFELYHSTLYNWSEYARKVIGIDSAKSIFLGGSEDRCVAWTKCTITNFCCGCDEKSFVTNTPIALTVTDGRSKCPNIYKNKLPICKASKSSSSSSSESGRWIYSHSSELKPGCNINPKSILNIVIPPSLVNSPAVLEHKNYIPNPMEWNEASGDPCLVRNYDMEDGNKGDWFYAPYRCDSMSRDLFSSVSSYLGVRPIAEDELKKLTNHLKQKKLQFHSGDVAL
eukprot:gene3094-6076_t